MGAAPVRVIVVPVGVEPEHVIVAPADVELVQVPVFAGVEGVLVVPDCVGSALGPVVAGLGGASAELASVEPVVPGASLWVPWASA